MMKILWLLGTLATVYGVEFEIYNYDGGDVWIGIQGSDGSENLKNGGFILGSGQSVSIVASNNWRGKFWGRTWCDDSSGRCLTGDCGKLECNGASGEAPVTIAEINLLTSSNEDTYKVSLSNGFNTLASVEPVRGVGDCQKAKCDYHINNDCPDSLKVDTEHGIIACRVSSDEEQYFRDRCGDAYFSKEYKCKASKYIVTIGG
ncbi:uncharacterized protein LOC109598797 [Aethina tumida]|uniref:uncharacterized protein LOC109598797 n=1 Tax=Aethina tumida TaxID=116153 RepID=UPI0021481CC0|nr:uncharacterized protein LOC109598797 [Aethina tumida]